MSSDTGALLQRLPKVELHAHLNGCIRESTLIELAAERDVVLNERYHFFINNNNNNHHLSSSEKPRPKRSLSECFEIFGEIAKFVDDLEALERITLEALSDFAEHGVAYLELRSTPKRLYQSSPKKNRSKQGGGSSVLATKKDYCYTILHVMKAFEEKEAERYANEFVASSSSSVSAPRLPLVCRFIVAIDRAQPVDSGMEHLNLALELRNDSAYANMIVGMDLGGNPLKSDFLSFRPCFEEARKHDLGITLHCAEVPCSEVQDGKTSEAYLDAESILDFGPDRLGHALLLPPSLHRKLARLRIPVESCPTSNVMTLELADTTHQTFSPSESVLEGLQRHPQLALWLFGETDAMFQDRKVPQHPICICTDDPGVFNTTATQELTLVQGAFDLNLEDLKWMVMQFMDYAFCDAETKKTVKDRLERVLQKVQ